MIATTTFSQRHLFIRPTSPRACVDPVMNTEKSSGKPVTQYRIIDALSTSDNSGSDDEKLVAPKPLKPNKNASSTSSLVPSRRGSKDGADDMMVAELEIQEILLQNFEALDSVVPSKTRSPTMTLSDPFSSDSNFDQEVPSLMDSAFGNEIMPRNWKNLEEDFMFPQEDMAEFNSFSPVPDLAQQENWGIFSPPLRSHNPITLNSPFALAEDEVSVPEGAEIGLLSVSPLSKDMRINGHERRRNRSLSCPETMALICGITA